MKNEQKHKSKVNIKNIKQNKNNHKQTQTHKHDKHKT